MSDQEQHELAKIGTSLAEINQPLLQHLQKDLNVITTKGELIRLQKAGFQLVIDLRKLADAGERLTKQPDINLLPSVDSLDKKLRSLVTEAQVRNRQEVLDIFEIKAKLLSSFIENVLFAIKSSPKKKILRKISVLLKAILLNLGSLTRRVRNSLTVRRSSPENTPDSQKTNSQSSIRQ